MLVFSLIIGNNLGQDWLNTLIILLVVVGIILVGAGLLKLADSHRFRRNWIGDFHHPIEVTGAVIIFIGIICEVLWLARFIFMVGVMIFR